MKINFYVRRQAKDHFENSVTIILDETPKYRGSKRRRQISF